MDDYDFPLDVYEVEDYLLAESWRLFRQMMRQYLGIN